MVEMEKAGVPTATVLSDGFQDDAAASAKAFGMAEVRYTVVPKMYNNITSEEAVAQTDPVIDDVIELLTTPNLVLALCWLAVIVGFLLGTVNFYLQDVIAAASFQVGNVANKTASTAGFEMSSQQK